ncbi:50S ribosomal protein L21 [bacterium]|nr:50S ribosomal protein L21 [bacterium]MBU1674760.1 50S ribosomal protein L21 [bacterium]
MYAIVNIMNRQFRVEPDATVQVPLMRGEIGDAVNLDEVLLYHDGKSTSVGAPSVAGCSVAAEIVRHGMGRKISVFKKKRRQNYRRNKSHRQAFTEIRIKNITV